MEAVMRAAAVNRARRGWRGRRGGCSRCCCCCWCHCSFLQSRRTSLQGAVVLVEELEEWKEVEEWKGWWDGGIASGRFGH